MLFLNKLEDWQLSDLSPTHPTMVRFESARQTFTSALIAQRSGETLDGYSPEADRLAVKSLAEGVEAGEQLTLIQAERQLKERASGQAYQAESARFKKLTQESPAPGAPVVVAGSGNGAILPGPAMIGCSVSPNQFSEGLQRAAMSSLDFVTMPMRWVDMEPREGKYNFANTDKWIEWAVRTAKVPVVAGPARRFPRQQHAGLAVHLGERLRDAARPRDRAHAGGGDALSAHDHAVDRRERPARQHQLQDQLRADHGPDADLRARDPQAAPARRRSSLR
jgi:hypothetical protein